MQFIVPDLASRIYSVPSLSSGILISASLFEPLIGAFPRNRNLISNYPLATLNHPSQTYQSSSTIVETPSQPMTFIRDLCIKQILVFHAFGDGVSID